MNPLPHWLASPEWTHLVKALLHTLWQAAALAMILGFVLRGWTNPRIRYRCSFAALVLVLFAGIVTWSALNRTSALPPVPTVTNPQVSVETPMEAPRLGTPDAVVVASRAPADAKLSPWTAWLGVVWIAGATLMVLRAGFQVAGAEKLRRCCRPLDDERIHRLAAEARRTIGLARQVQIVATEKLTSPAVVGVLVPTLILPLSLVTTLTPEQIRFILLHELAHIRRGDYLANLFQLFVEALLFFNPAVWWISHQVRREREACCDALAIELSGAPADYARTLLHVAESTLAAPAAATAFGKQQEPSSLSDRVQRLLIPGYRPALRLTWRAMVGTLILGAALLVLSAVGTRITVAAILSPQQRIDRIEHKMVEMGQAPRAIDFQSSDAETPKVEISGRVRMADGSPVPKWCNIGVDSQSAQSSYGSAISAKDGVFSTKLRQGIVIIAGEITNYAPAQLGPIDAIGSNRIDNLELVFEPGFDVQLKAIDADTGKPIPDANVAMRFWIRGGNMSSFAVHRQVTDSQGSTVLAHAADMPLEVTLNAPDYEIVQQKFDSVKPGRALQISARRGVAVFGIVQDKTTGAPIPDAVLRVLHETGPVGSIGYSWEDPMRVIVHTGSDGRFNSKQLRRDTRYYIGVTAPGHETLVLNSVSPNQSNLVARLGPELLIKGRIIGNLELLNESGRSARPQITATVQEGVAEHGSTHGYLVDVRMDSGIGYFEFTNRVAGPVELQIAGQTFRRVIDAPTEWRIDLAELRTNALRPVSKREVVFRFKHSSGVLPKGTVNVTVPVNLDPEHRSSESCELEIRNGEVRQEMPIGGRTSIEPRHTVGYWFKEDFAGYIVTKGSGPMVIEIPVVPAGAIYARARNADGTPASGLFFSVEELKRSPLRDANASLGSNGDSIRSGEGPRRWVSGPLPLDGTYQIIGWRNNSFCISKPVKLTEEQPDAEVELQFPASRTLTGRVLNSSGNPVPDATITGTFTFNKSHSFGLKTFFTDSEGQFQIFDATPGVGEYSVEIGNCPGWQSERVKLGFDRPTVVRLKPGFKLFGQVVEAETGRVIPDAEIRAWTADGKSELPQQKTRTDSSGHFEFGSLGNANYSLFVDGANFADITRAQTFKAGQTNAITLRVKPYPGSRLAPKAAEAAKVGTNAVRSLEAEAPQRKPAESWKISVEFVGFNDPGLMAGPDGKRIQMFPTPGLRFHSANFNASISAVFIESASVEEQNLPLEKIPGVREFKFNLQRILGKSEMPGDVEVYREAIQRCFEENGVQLSAPKAVSVEGNSVVVHVTFSNWVTVAQKSAKAGRKISTKPLPESPTIRIGEGRRAILMKLQDIRLENFSADAQPLSNVLRQLSQQVRVSDSQTNGINFMIAPNSDAGTVPNSPRIDPATGLPVSPWTNSVATFDVGSVLVTIRPALTNVRLADVLNAITAAADKPIKYSILDYGIAFSPKGEETAALHMRRYKVDVDGLMTRIGVTSSNTPAEFQAAVLRFFSTKGVDLSPTSGKNVFFKDSEGSLLVRATTNELDWVEKALNGLGTLPPPTTAEARTRTATLVQNGKYYYEAGKLDEAQAELEKASALDPENEAARFYLGLVKSQKEKGGTHNFDPIKRAIVHPMVTFTNLEEREFRMDTNRLVLNLGNFGVLDSAKLRQARLANDPGEMEVIVGSAIFDWFAKNGVDIQQFKVPTLRWDGATGILQVRATDEEMKKIEALAARLDIKLPQINIKTKFVAIPEKDVEAFRRAIKATNSAAAGTGILNPAQFRNVLSMLQSRKEVDLLNGMQVTTYGGCQAQIQSVDMKSFPTNINPRALTPPGIVSSHGTNDLLQFATVSLGSIFDVLPTAGVDGWTIGLNMTFSLTEFLGYEKGETATAYVDGAETKIPLSKPRFNIRKLSGNAVVWDGQTVVLFGDSVKNDSAKAGEQSKQLLVFATATLINEVGNRIHSDAEMEFDNRRLPPQPPERIF